MDLIGLRAACIARRSSYTAVGEPHGAARDFEPGSSIEARRVYRSYRAVLRERLRASAERQKD